MSDFDSESQEYPQDPKEKGTPQEVVLGGKKYVLMTRCLRPGPQYTVFAVPPEFKDEYAKHPEMITGEYGGKESMSVSTEMLRRDLGYLGGVKKSIKGIIISLNHQYSEELANVFLGNTNSDTIALKNAFSEAISGALNAEYNSFDPSELESDELPFIDAWFFSPRLISKYQNINDNNLLNNLFGSYEVKITEAQDYALKTKLRRLDNPTRERKTPAQEQATKEQRFKGFVDGLK